MIDWDTVDWANVVSIAGIIGTWITILLVYFTLREMRNQRLASQKPDIVIVKSRIAGYISAPKDAHDSNRLLVGRYTGKESVQFYNVGFGVAKNIKIRWIGKYSKTIAKIKEYCYDNSIPIVLQVQENRLNVTEQGIGTYSGLTLLDEIIHRDYLMPVSITSEGLTFGVPSSFLSLITILMYLKGHKDRQYPYEVASVDLGIDFPPMQLEISFDDVEDIHYSRKFDVTISSSAWLIAEDRPTSGSKEAWTASLEFKKAEATYIPDAVLRARRAEQRRREMEK